MQACRWPRSRPRSRFIEPITRDELARRLAVLTVFLSLAECAPVTTGQKQAPYASYSPMGNALAIGSIAPGMHEATDGASIH